MIDAMLAKNLIKRVAAYTEYNINIMDDRGIIIASKDPARIGTFHEIALQIMQGNEDCIIVHSEKAGEGVKNGVNLAIYYGKKKEGVLGITGNPDEVEKIGLIIKMSVEVMLEHEIMRNEKVRRRNQKEQFLAYLLYGTDIQADDYSYYLENLQLKENVIRIPIMITIRDEVDNNVREYILSLYRNQWKHSSQDMSCITREGDILIYKYMNDMKDAMLQYKYFIADHMSEVLRYLRNAGYRFSIYSGAFQTEFKGYRFGYEQCLWMKNSLTQNKSYHFYDHCHDYMLSRVPFQEIRNMSAGIERCLDKKQIDNFVEVMEALRNANYKLADAGALIHVHKNTLAYRLDKFREILHLDPLGNAEDRYLCNVLVYYFKKKENAPGRK